MADYAILADVNWCTGCEACILACQQELGYDETKSGVEIEKIGPVVLDAAKKLYQYDFIPRFTEYCDLCAERTGKGKQPSCVQHCQAQCLEWGPADELAKKVDDRHLLFTVSE